MSSDSDSQHNTKVYKLRSRKNFPSWKQKTLSMASSKGYERFLLEDVTIESEDDIDDKEIAMIEETYPDKRRKLKAELAKMTKIRKKSLNAAAMLTSSVKSKDLKMLSNCGKDPKKMYDLLCNRYGKQDDTDLTELTQDFRACKLKGKRHDPVDWFADMDEINGQLKEIDPDFAKSDKELSAHIIRRLPKGYKSLKTIIRMDDNHLDNLTHLKDIIAKHWKENFRGKTKKRKSKRKERNDYSDDESSDSSSDSSSSDSNSSDSNKKERKKKSKDRYAF